MYEHNQSTSLNNDRVTVLALSVPDEGYSRSALCALNLISTFILIHSEVCLGPRFYTPIKLHKMHSILIITFKSHQNLI